MTVHLVGAGPGDPGLLTRRGAALLARADIVIHDRLAEASLLDLAPAGAVRIDVGKTPGQSIDQEGINRLLVQHGLAGKEVVRLKGGDPFVFGRGGEEALALIEAGVPFTVVPGISSAIAAAAYAGIPITHRGLSTSFTVVTGHSRHEVDDAIDWTSLARAGDTIVVLMGVAHRAEIAARLIAGGRAHNTPVACVRWGTRPEQQTIRTTLADLGAAPLEAPVAIVIGEVAGLDLGWFEGRPLFGRTVVVTRARDQASTLVTSLSDLGASVLEVPTIAIGPAGDGGAALAAVVERLCAGDRPAWLVCTSTNGVAAITSRLRDARDLGGVLVAAVGDATADAFRRFGVEPDLVPPRALAASLVEAFPSGDAGRVLCPLGDRASATLADGLGAKGWDVEVVEAYATTTAVVQTDVVARALAADAICFSSASTVTGWIAAAGPDVPKIVVSIGPVTSDAALAAGLDVAIEADPHTVPGLVDAVVRALS